MPRQCGCTAKQAGVIETLFDNLKDQGWRSARSSASIVAVPKQRNSRKENAGIWRDAGMLAG